MITIKKILNKFQAPNNIAGLDFLLILAHVINKDKTFILAHPEFRLSLTSYFLFLYFVRQRRRGMPLAYITGHKEFFGIDFFVNKHTLIPRPDTEILVESVIEEIKKSKDQKIALIDVGTGSGCIPISIIKTLEHENTRLQRYAQHCGQVKTFAIDISRRALKIAKKNARIQNVSIKFLQGNLLKPVIEILKTENSEIVITGNLPYGWKEWKNESSVETVGLKYEPAQALFTGENGLELIRQLLEQLQTLSARHVTAFLEYDPRQTELLTALVKKICPTARYDIKKDLAGRDRVLIVRFS